MMITKKFKKDFKYRNLGGTKITLEFEVSTKEIERKAKVEGNWACYNFIDRRPDFKSLFDKKIYYGHAEDGLGYVVCDDELEGI